MHTILYTSSFSGLCPRMCPYKWTPTIKIIELLTTHELMTAAPPFLQTLLHLLFWHAHLTVFVISTFYHLALRHPKGWEILRTFLTSLSVTLACTATSMTVTLNTDDVFKGKLFAFLNPRACLVKGKGRRQTSLTFQVSD